MYSTGVEYGDEFEGDMILSDEQLVEMFSPVRNGLIDKKYRWPNATVPYVMSSNYTKEQVEVIQSAFDWIQADSCIKFIERTDQDGYIEIGVSLQLM